MLAGRKITMITVAGQRYRWPFEFVRLALGFWVGQQPEEI